jgi:hypothetical protein
LSEPKVLVKSITFSDNTTIQLSGNDVVVIVGPNNSGKSATFRAIRDKFAIPQSPGAPHLPGVGRCGKARTPAPGVLYQGTTSVVP